MISQATWDLWYKRIADLPTTNFKIAVGTLLFIATGLSIGVTVMASVLYSQYTKTPYVPADQFIKVLEVWLDALLIYIGIGAVQYVGKRATEKKPEQEQS